MNNLGSLKNMQRMLKDITDELTKIENDLKEAESQKPEFEMDGPGVYRKRNGLLAYIHSEIKDDSFGFKGIHDTEYGFTFDSWNEQGKNLGNLHESQNDIIEKLENYYD